MRTTIHFYFSVSLSLVSFQHVISKLSAERLSASMGRPRPATSRRAAATLPGRRHGPCLASGAYRQASASPPQRCPWSRDPVATPARGPSHARGLPYSAAATAMTNPGAARSPHRRQCLRPALHPDSMPRRPPATPAIFNSNELQERKIQRGRRTESESSTTQTSASSSNKQAATVLISFLATK